MKSFLSFSNGKAGAHADLPCAIGCGRPGPSALMLENVSHAYGDAPPVLRDLSLCMHVGEIVSLVGPSGCGKTTTLRLVAGLEAVQSGSVTIGGAVAGAPGRHLAAEDRNVGMMFQDYALFPHLTVAKNVAFGLSRRVVSDKRSRALEILRDVGLEEFADRNPSTLSGGQQQRVALARALAPRPKVVLLDEPFSGLDTELRRKIRGDAIHLLKASGAAALMVTHDPEEALFMSERIAVMRDGRIEQFGEPKALYDSPASPYVARFFSEINELTGRVHGGKVSTELGDAPAASLDEGVAARLMIRPEHVLIGEAALATGRAVDGAVSFARWLGRTALTEVRLPSGATFFVRTAEAVPPADGESLPIALDLARLHCFPDDEGAAAPAIGGAEPAKRLAFQDGLR